MVNKKAVVIATVIAILVIGTIIGIKIYQLNKDDNTEIASESDKVKNVDEVKGNKVDNSILENNITETNNLNTTNTSSDNTSKTNTSENTQVNTTKSTDEKRSEEDLEKVAIDLVKNKFGNSSSNVYYNVDDELSDGVYIVSVRNEETTTEIASYKVDTKNKTVTEN